MHLFLQKITNFFYSLQERAFCFVPVLFGIGIGIYFLFPFEPSIWASCILLELLIVAAYIFRFNRPALFLIAVFAIVSLGFVNVQLKAYTLAKNQIPSLYGEKIYLKGIIKSKDYNYRGMPRIILEDVKDFNNKSIKGFVKVNLRFKKDKLVFGDCVEMVVKVYPPLEPVMVGGYQFNRKYFFDGITFSGAAEGRVLPMRCEKKFSFGTYVNLLREGIVGRIKQAMPSEEAGIAAAIIAGEKGRIPHKIYENYRDSGLAHFLSISGLHMSMVAGLVFFWVRLAVALVPKLSRRQNSKKIAAGFAMMASLVYLFISGAEIPSQRAFIMMLVVLLGVLFNRRAISLKSISIAALLILIISPEALIGASFQMSFAAVFCLIAFYEKYAGAIHNFIGRGGFLKSIILYAGGLVVADLIASLATLPFVIYHFNRISIYTTIGNFLAGPIIALLIMPCVVLTLLLMPFGLDWWFLKLLGFSIKLVNEITAYVASLPNAGYQIMAMPFFSLIMIVFGGLWLGLVNNVWRRAGVALIVFGFLTMLFNKTPDVIVNKDVFAVKDETGNLVVMPARGTAFEKKLWLEKTASKPLDEGKNDLLRKIYKGKVVDKSWLDLECNDSNCEYKGLVLNKKDLGVVRSIWLLEDGSMRVKTVNESVGDRYWK